MSLSMNELAGDPRTAAAPRRQRCSVLANKPATDAPDSDADAAEERHEWKPVIARQRWSDIRHAETGRSRMARPLPAIDADGRMIVPPELLARMTVSAICAPQRTSPRTPQRPALGPRGGDDVALYTTRRCTR